jgi:integrase
MRAVIDHNLSTRAARERLDVRRKPYFRSLDTGLHIGYVRSETKSVWIGRIWLAGKYITSVLGEADDHPDRPGMSYGAALDAVRAWAKRHRETARLVALGEDVVPDHAYTVKAAIEDYLKDAERRGVRSVKKTILPALRCHVLASNLANVPLRDLTTARLRAWHQGIANSAPKRRTGEFASKPNHGSIPVTDEQKRRRAATANHVRALLFAVFNFAFTEGRVESDRSWRRCKPFRGCDEPKVRYLTSAEAKRLLAAAEPDLKLICAGALLTGARYGELCRLVASDFDPRSATIFISARAKNSKARHVYLTREGVQFFRRATQGLKGNQLIFTHADGTSWGPNHQQQGMIDACEAAEIVPAVTFHILRHSYASLLTQAGAPLQTIAAQLGHHSVRVTERAYAHLSPQSIATQIQSALPAFGVHAKGC